MNLQPMAICSSTGAAAAWPLPFPPRPGNCLPPALSQVEVYELKEPGRRTQPADGGRIKFAFNGDNRQHGYQVQSLRFGACDQLIDYRLVRAGLGTNIGGNRRWRLPNSRLAGLTRRARGGAADASDQVAECVRGSRQPDCPLRLDTLLQPRCHGVHVESLLIGNGEFDRGQDNGNTIELGLGDGDLVRLVGSCGSVSLIKQLVGCG